MSKNKKIKKKQSEDVWTEEQYEEYIAALYGFEFIAGYTESGAPYGIPKEDIEDTDEQDKDDAELFLYFDNDEIPF